MRNCLVFFATLFSILSFAEPSFSFSLQSTAFSDEGALPILYTCDNSNISPPLSWRDPPEHTVSYVFIVSDPDAPGENFYHWIVYNIPTEITQFQENMTTYPTGVKVGQNSWHKLEYNGPCPPRGGNAHNYSFTLYALDSRLNFTSAPDGPGLENALRKHILSKTVLTTFYGRPSK
jgi:Raf kinase inhibitor-like YbhB/YbcL family protein